MFTINNKVTSSYVFTFEHATSCSSVSIVNFEDVLASWVYRFFIAHFQQAFAQLDRMMIRHSKKKPPILTQFCIAKPLKTSDKLQVL